MTLTKRIIPCLDIHNGQTVKGIRFEQLRAMGDPVELADYYTHAGADELVFLDISATHEQRKTFAGLVKRIAREISIPFTVGGGISSVSDVHTLLSAGADKISVNSAAVKQPKLISELARSFGSQCIVLAIDTQYDPDKADHFVHVNGGRIATGIKTIDWVNEGASRGAGEILLTSIDHDGTRGGFALELTRTIATSLHVPVIASGGAGNMAHFADVFTEGKADAALAAGIFHNKELTIPELKQYLKTQKINVRI